MHGLEPGGSPWLPPGRRQPHGCTGSKIQKLQLEFLGMVSPTGARARISVSCHGTDAGRQPHGCAFRWCQVGTISAAGNTQVLRHRGTYPAVAGPLSARSHPPGGGVGRRCICGEQKGTPPQPCTASCVAPSPDAVRGLTPDTTSQRSGQLGAVTVNLATRAGLTTF